MYQITLSIDEISEEDVSTVSEVSVIYNVELVTWEDLKAVTDRLCKMAFEKEFMRKGR